MQAQMDKIYENEKFALYTGMAGKNTGLFSFCPDDGSGLAINDTFSVSSAQCTVADFNGTVRAYEPWQDIGKGHTRPGAKAMIWDENCQHWCACTNDRAVRVDYIITGKVYVLAAEETKEIPVQAGDYLAVVEGEVVLDPHERSNRQVRNLFVTEIAKRRTIRVLSVRDSVVFIITPTIY